MRRSIHSPDATTAPRSSVRWRRELDREGSAGTGAVYVDLDQFKPVNDTLGHAAGDELLVLVAERLRLASRDTDLIGRLGGDEFLVVLHDIPGPDVAMRVAERICERAGDLRALLRQGRAARQRRGGLLPRLGDQRRRAREVCGPAMYESKQHGQCAPVMAAA